MVDILLATYNGADYLREQIGSVISQTFTDWRLLVHDDGSTDATVDVVKELSAQDSRIKLIDDGLKFGNAGENFMHLLKFSTAEYVMFCDQDDVWFDNKVELMHRAIAEADPSVPTVVYSNSYVWKPSSGIKGLATLTYATDLRSLLFLNSGVQGCVSIFNGCLRDLLAGWEGETSMHDHILHLAAASLGEVKVENKPLMYYRQHEHTVTPETRTRLFTLRSQLRNFRRPVVSRTHYDSVRKFYELYKDRITPDKQRILQAYLDMPRKGRLKRLQAIVKHRFTIYDSTFLLLTKALLRPFI